MRLSQLPLSGFMCSASDADRWCLMKLYTKLFQMYFKGLVVSFVQDHRADQCRKSIFVSLLQIGALQTASGEKDSLSRHVKGKLKCK